MKRTMRRLERIDAFAVLLPALLFAGCTVQEGETPPCRTQAEYAIYTSLSDVRELFAGDMFLAAGLREWMAQTTDEGREAIRKRFFAWGEVVPESEQNWTLTGSDTATPSYVMERHLEFEAVQTSPGSVKIIREDLTEEWNL